MRLLRILIALLVMLPSLSSVAQSCDHMLLFDGYNSFIDCGPGDNLNIEGQLTVEAWVKLDQRFAMQHVIGNFDQNSFNGFYMAIQNQALNCAVKDSVNGTKSFNVYQVPFNVWTHIAFTYKTGGRFRGYINGKVRIDVPASTTRIGNQTSSHLIIGSAPWRPDTLVAQGNIDEVRIYNLERSANQIREDMRMVLSTPQSGLIGYWKMAEGTGVTTADLSGSGCNGNLSGVVLPTWQTAEGPYGEGSCYLAAPASSGVLNFPGTDLEMNFLQSCLDTFVVSNLQCSPNVLPVCCANYSDSYWIIDRYGVLNPVSYDLNFSLPPGAVSVTDELNPTNIQLQQRDGFSTGTWTNNAFAVSASSVSADVQFANTGVPGQLLLGTTGNSALNNLESVNSVAASVVVFPNPADNSFSVELSPSLVGSTEIKIYDAVGRIVLSPSVNIIDQAVVVETKNWNSGLYYVTVLSATNYYVQKLLVNKNVD